MTDRKKEPPTRVTFGLTPRSATALALAVELTGDNKTDILNRALQVYAYLEHVLAAGGRVLTEEDGALTEVRFFIG